MSEAARKIRLRLMETVRPLWGTQEALKLRDELSKEAIKAIEECYAQCARNGPIVECYRRCAEQAKLGMLYRKIWKPEVYGG